MTKREVKELFRTISVGKRLADDILERRGEDMVREAKAALGDIFDTMNEEQKLCCYALVGCAVEEWEQSQAKSILAEMAGMKPEDSLETITSKLILGAKDLSEKEQRERAKRIAYNMSILGNEGEVARDDG